MPGYIYFFFHYLENPDLSATQLNLSLPPLRKCMAHLVCWAFTSVVLMLATNHYIRAVRSIWCICLGFLMLLLLGCAAPDGKPDGKGSFLDLLLVGTSNITDISSWTNTLNNAVTLYGLGRAFHVVEYPQQRSYVIWSRQSFSCSIVCINKIAHYTKTDRDHLSHISWGISDNIYFYVLPQGLGFMGIPQLWSCVYFGLCILLNLNQQLTHLIMMEKALSDIYPNLSRYTRYVLTFFCIFTCIVSSLFLSKDSFLTYKEICYVIANNNEMFNVVVMCILVCWIYGVQRFSDDIHFTTGKETTMFWKICWYCLPIIAMAAHGEIMILQNQENTNTRVLDAILYWILGSPVPIMAIIQIFKFMRKRDLFGVLRAEERFGPPERQERHMRRLFNPRKETKSKRRMQICQHPCIINNHVVELVIKSETGFREQCEEKLMEDYISDEE
ncbi:Sodium:neurotransmitter symporter family [Popillia japonica]|uniref:Sodium:neurotransmitter symporter family n=1 Tax=Popillia japonica TaxID=7064 RepID=A0AAW1M9C6_POPJA